RACCPERRFVVSFFFSSRRRHTRSLRDWSSDVCSSDLFLHHWYEVMPMMKKVRAPGMAFFLVALPVAAFAGFGAERLCRRQVTRSEERRVGKECRSRRRGDELKRKQMITPFRRLDHNRS